MYSLFQTLKDEHQALQMAFTALEEKYRKVQEDNSELMARWLNQKMKEADIMNQENDRFFKWVFYMDGYLFLVGKGPSLILILSPS